MPSSHDSNHSYLYYNAHACNSDSSQVQVSSLPLSLHPIPRHLKFSLVNQTTFLSRDGAYGLDGQCLNHFMPRFMQSGRERYFDQSYLQQVSDYMHLSL